jgi:hypothetical protein
MQTPARLHSRVHHIHPRPAVMAIVMAMGSHCADDEPTLETLLLLLLLLLLLSAKNTQSDAFAPPGQYRYERCSE